MRKIKDRFIVIVFLISLALIFCGCEALDEQVKDDNSELNTTARFVEDNAESIAAGSSKLPYGEWVALGVLAAGGLAATYDNVRQRIKKKDAEVRAEDMQLIAEDEAIASNNYRSAAKAVVDAVEKTDGSTQSKVKSKVKENLKNSKSYASGKKIISDLKNLD